MTTKFPEVASIIKEQIEGFDSGVEFKEVGQVVSIGDGIAKVYGLDRVEYGEMVEFENGSKGMALNLEQDSVGIVVFGDVANINEGSYRNRS
ncbi:MAG: hypothetical protein K0T99_04000 [Alphaproteobacteria bacterium]|nr:hypothetical protein [Alphaproteobacteria bacterium]